jgi:hypothetical protein
MATIAIPVYGEIIILSMEYDPTGLEWVKLYDNHCLSWLVSDIMSRWYTSVTGMRALSLILGSLATYAPNTAPILSPQWGKFADPVVFIPDIARIQYPISSGGWRPITGRPRNRFEAGCAARCNA